MKSTITLLLLLCAFGLSAQGVIKTDPVETVASRVRLICVEPTMGKPLYVYDGVPIDSAQLAVLQQDDLKSLSVMRPKRAHKLYGPAGQHGVVVLRSKNVRYIQVIDPATGAAVAGAAVQLSAKNKKAVHQLTTDPTGTVRLDQLKGKQSYVLTVTASGYAPVTFEYLPGTEPFKKVEMKNE